jgi:hypothetical protein
MRALWIGIVAFVVFGGERRDDCCEHMATHMGNMHGTMGHGMSCRQMASRLDVRVEEVPGGSVIRVLSKDPAMVDQARTMARMMSSCLSR